MEKIPGFKIFGDMDNGVKEEITGKYYNRLHNHNEQLPIGIKKQFEQFEIEKTPEQLEFIDAANQETNKILVGLGLESFDIPYENVHFVREDHTLEGLGVGGSMANIQGVAIVCRESKISTASTVLHEFLHLKGAHVLRGEIEVTETPERISKMNVISEWRYGVSAFRNSEPDVDDHYKRYHFGGLHEAIVAYQTKKSLPSIINTVPSLLIEKKRIDNILSDERYKDHIAGILNRNNDIDRSEIVDIKLEDNNGSIDTDTTLQSYLEQRKVLEYVCKEILLSNLEDYSSFDQVYAEFLRAQFGGQLLQIGRLMKKTFGEDGLRILAEMDNSKESALETLEKLRTKKEEVKGV